MSGRFLLFPCVLPCVTPQVLLRHSAFLRAMPVPPLLFLLDVKTKLIKGWIILHPELSLLCHCTLTASYSPPNGQIGSEGFFSSLNPPPNPPTLPFVLCISALAGVSWHHEELMSPGPRCRAVPGNELRGSRARALRAEQAKDLGLGTHLAAQQGGCARMSPVCLPAQSACGGWAKAEGFGPHSLRQSCVIYYLALSWERGLCLSARGCGEMVLLGASTALPCSLPTAGAL